MPDFGFNENFIARQITIPPQTSYPPGVFGPVTLPPCTLLDVQIMIPPGPNGVAGLGIAYNNVRILPYGDDAAFVIGNDITRTFPVNAYINGRLLLVAFNVGLWPHTFYVFFHIRYDTPPVSTTPDALVL